MMKKIFRPFRFHSRSGSTASDKSMTMDKAMDSSIAMEPSPPMAMMDSTSNGMSGHLPMMEEQPGFMAGKEYMIHDDDKMMGNDKIAMKDSMIGDDSMMMGRDSMMGKDKMAMKESMLGDDSMAHKDSMMRNDGRIMKSPSPPPPTATRTSKFTAANTTKANSPPPPVSQPLTIIELYTSQSCSSCPPATANIHALPPSSATLLLSYHVTYWNHLSWRDTYSHPAHDARQRAFAAKLGRRNVFTPQLIVNGVIDGVGSRRGEASDLISRGMGRAGGAVVETVVGGVLVSPPSPPSTSSSKPSSSSSSRASGKLVYLVTFDPAPAPIYVPMGENAGRTLQHRNVVVDLMLLGEWDGCVQTFAVGGAEDRRDRGYGAVVLVQEGEGGRILGAAKV
ncbi:MAG: hypothetical protein M1829_004153 [Trizodia sp. TS-e1964]|nr:MAG: hypothetical protein M1829_004153 [Trizodia sp. TS-e1964]